QWLFCPSGSSVARNGKPLIVPSTVVMPREGSFALASFGRVRKVQAPDFPVAAGRSSSALKQILKVVLLMVALYTYRNTQSLSHQELAFRMAKPEQVLLPGQGCEPISFGLHFRPSEHVAVISVAISRSAF